MQMVVNQNILMYDAAGVSYETQSSAFTETLKTQIGTNASNITILQNSNSSLNSSITALQSSDTSQNSTLSTHTSQITALQNANTDISSITSKTQNISSANTTSTNFSKPIYSNTPDALRIYGDHNYISGWSNTTNSRDWILGTILPNSKQCFLTNDAEEGIYLRTGTRSGNTNVGQNKIVTYSNGIQLKRGGLTDTLITVGEIGGTNTNNNFYINGNGVNNIVIDSGIGSLLLYTKNFTVDNGGAGPDIINKCFKSWFWNA